MTETTDATTTPPDATPPDATTTPPTTRVDLSDIGNAAVFVDCATHDDTARDAAERLLYLGSDRGWYCCDVASSLWRRDTTGATMRCAMRMTERLRDIADAQSDVVAENAKRSPKQNAHAWAIRSRALARLSAATTIAASWPTVAAELDDFDADPYLLSVHGALVDLRSSTTRERTPADRIMQRAGSAYEPHATSTQWLAFLRSCAPADGADAWINYLQRAVGASLIGEQRDSVLFFCHGRGANGKTTFLETIRAALGSYAVQMMPDMLMLSRNERHTSELVDLRGARMAISAEVQSGGRLDEGKVKRLTGGGSITAARKGKDSETFAATFTLWIDGNSDPAISGTDDGIWRRIKKIPWVRDFSKEPITDMRAKLRAELPAVLSWAIEGARLYIAHGLGEPAIVTEATAEYRATEDVLGAILAELVTDSPADDLECKRLYELIADEYETAGHRRPTAIRINRRLREKGYEQTRAKAGDRSVRAWRGRRLTAAASMRSTTDGWSPTIQ